MVQSEFKRTYSVVDERAVGGNDGIKSKADAFDIGVEAVGKLDILCRLDVVDHLVEFHHVRGGPENLLDR